MLYIHGGGPFGNSSRYRADYLMDEDIIFITLHYRLGALGKLEVFRVYLSINAHFSFN